MNRTPRTVRVQPLSPLRVVTFGCGEKVLRVPVSWLEVLPGADPLFCSRSTGLGAQATGDTLRESKSIS